MAFSRAQDAGSSNFSFSEAAVSGAQSVVLLVLSALAVMAAAPAANAQATRYEPYLYALCKDKEERINLLPLNKLMTTTSKRGTRRTTAKPALPFHRMTLQSMLMH